MLANIEGEANIETLPRYIFVFVNEVLNKNYTNISVAEWSKFVPDVL